MKHVDTLKRYGWNPDRSLYKIAMSKLKSKLPKPNNVPLS